MTYKLSGKDFNDQDLKYIIRKSDGAFIPMDEETPITKTTSLGSPRETRQKPPTK